MKAMFINFFLIFSLVNVGFSAVARTDKNPLDWKEESEEHRNRLVEYAEELYAHLPEFHQHWKYFIKYMRLHDLPKVMTHKEILAVYPQYDHPLSIYERMALFYGLDEKDMNAEQKREFKNTREDLNRIEDFLKKQFKETVPVDTPNFAQVEMALDFIDTTIFRRQELNIEKHEYGYYLAVVRFLQRGQPELANKALVFLNVLRKPIEANLKLHSQEVDLDITQPFQISAIRESCDLTLALQ